MAFAFSGFSALINISGFSLLHLNFQEDFVVGRLYPGLERIQEVSVKIATNVVEAAFK